METDFINVYGICSFLLEEQKRETSKVCKNEVLLPVELKVKYQFIYNIKVLIDLFLKCKVKQHIITIVK